MRRARRGGQVDVEKNIRAPEGIVNTPAVTLSINGFVRGLDVQPRDVDVFQLNGLWNAILVQNF